MKKEVVLHRFIFIFLLLVIVMAGCATLSKLMPSKCPKSCEDKNKCTVDYCSEATEFLCKHDILLNCNGNGICEEGEYQYSTDCPDCADANPCTVDTYDYANSSCKHIEIKDCCGNGVCESVENRTSCPKDCPDCNDNNDCTIDEYNYEKKVCEHLGLSPCCGNKVCEVTESYFDCSEDCPPNEAEQFAECANDECKLNVAIQFKDEKICPKLLTSSNTDKCYEEIGVITNRLELCSLIQSTELMLNCKEEIAVKTNDTQLCLSTLTRANVCLEKIAVAKKDVLVCNLLKEEFVATRDDFVKKCYAKVTANYLNCKAIERVWIKDLCYRELALMLNDTSICEGVKENPQECVDAIGGTV